MLITVMTVMTMEQASMLVGLLDVILLLHTPFLG